MNDDRAVVLDFFTTAFFQHCWGILEGDSCRSVMRSLLTVKSEVHDTTFIILIPKKNGCSNLEDICPISLAGSVYKFLTSVNVN